MPKKLTNEPHFQIQFSPIYGTLSEQLRAQNLQFVDETTKEIHEYCAKCIFSLKVRGLLAEGERDRIYKRLLKRMAGDIIPLKDTQ